MSREARNSSTNDIMVSESPIEISHGYPLFSLERSSHVGGAVPFEEGEVGSIAEEAAADITIHEEGEVEEPPSALPPAAGLLSYAALLPRSVSVPG